MKNIFILLALMSLTLQMPAQTTSDGHNSGFQSDAVSRAPLLLFTNGQGQVFPLRNGQIFRLHNGQMLEVGGNYVLEAVPDRGFAFTNWNPVRVFTFTEVILDESGNANTITNMVVSPVPNYTRNPVLRFTMQPVEVLYDVPGVGTITEGEGWQANFVPARFVPPRRWGRVGD